MTFTPIPDNTQNWGFVANSAFEDIQSQITLNQNTTAYGGWTPDDQGLIAWTVDPAQVASTATWTTGVLQLSAVAIKRPAFISNLTIGVSTAQTAGTAGQNFAGLYDFNGNLLGQTADQAAAWSTAAIKIMPLVTQVTVQPGKYWTALLANGTNSPAIIRGGTATGTMINVGTSPTTRRFATQGAALTALPATFDPTTIVSGTSPWNVLVN